MEEIENLWCSLQLIEEEQDGIIWGGFVEKEYKDEGDKWLVGKVKTSSPFNKEAMVSTMKIIWKLVKMVEIQMLEDNLFLFKFSSVVDKNRVLEGALWSFDKHILVLKEYVAVLRPDEHVFLNSFLD
ncbi:hypothetical protein REPUB_Repub08aG0089600 [Reevesia pubescens]